MFIKKNNLILLKNIKNINLYKSKIMIKYDFRHPEELYEDILEKFDCKVNKTLSVYINTNSDDQKKIKKWIDNNDLELLHVDNVIYINILMNVNYKNENKWLLSKACCNPFYGSIPFSFFGNLQYIENEVLTEHIFHYLINYNEINKICNSCNKIAKFNCPECDNVDFCEDCFRSNMHEKIHLNKLNDKDEIFELCDVCGKNMPSYGNKKYYCLCEECFNNNPHKNHKLVKIKEKDNFLTKKELIVILKKKIYMHFAFRILSTFDKTNKWEPFEKDNICSIFNSNNKIVKENIKNVKISKKILDELKRIEKEFANHFDKVIRKFFVYKYEQFNFLYGNKMPFTSNNSIATFYFDAINMIKKINTKDNIVSNEDNIEL